MSGFSDQSLLHSGTGQRRMSPTRSSSYRHPDPMFMELDNSSSGFMTDFESTHFSNEIRSGHFDQIGAATTGIANVVAEQLLSHPCAVLRRQCQVNAVSTSFHNTPFTLLPVAYTLQSNQGFWSLWKGIGASVIAKGLTTAVEVLIGETFGLPRLIVEESKVEKIMHHVLLKMLSLASTTPFIVAAFVETVRSDTVSDKRSMLDCLTNGFGRVRYEVFAMRDSMRENSKRFSIFYLVAPSVIYRFSHYLFAQLAYNVIYRLARRHIQRKKHRTMFDDYYPAMFARLMSGLAADALLFPLELVLHRLYIQGTRTIIDNLDTGLSVVAVSTNYHGVAHCFSTIMQNDGVWGFYKGFGAVTLQYLLHFMVMRITRMICDHVEQFMTERQLDVIDEKPASFGDTLSQF